ncbi:hypothetical protein VNO77_39201 [Canavalia gladiata]|uniref:Uncharacterized protein n=1 Tax=Canavalia gladiata TaxID=3824 RepID=A0AAN9KBT4_CANGL
MFKNIFQSRFLSILYSLGYGTKKVSTFWFTLALGGHIFGIWILQSYGCTLEVFSSLLRHYCAAEVGNLGSKPATTAMGEELSTMQ